MTAMISDSTPGARVTITPRTRAAGRKAMRGREAEQKIVRDLLRRAKRGVGGGVLVDGEPGIGKSLLLPCLTGAAAEQGWSLVRCSGPDSTRFSPSARLGARVPRPGTGEPDGHADPRC